jgi:error-prone DNA polymerase
VWAIQSLGPLEEDDLFFGLEQDKTEVDLPPLTDAERVSADFETLGVSLSQHPLALFRKGLIQRGAMTAAQLSEAPPGRFVRVGGMVICRQRPPTAKGVSFLSLEDETGVANVVVPPQLFARYRREILASSFLYAEGQLQRAGRVINIQTRRLTPLVLEG